MNRIVSPPLTLCNGDRMKQPEFHRRYKAYPKQEKFELIGGIVYVASPLRRPHAMYEEELSFPLGLYRRATPGVELLPNATTILSEDNEPQPDLGLRLLEEYGGRSRLTPEEYIEGPPELLAEIAYSSWAMDMNQKRDAYQQTGVLEYLVLLVEERQLHWFDFQRGRLIRPNREGISCSRVFPGLWLDGGALLARDSRRVQEVVQLGLASPEHARFVKRLERARRRHP
jgi:Putative restriction endonuclease